MMIRTITAKYAGTENELWSDLARSQVRTPKVEYSGNWNGMLDDPALIRVAAESSAIQKFLDFACVCPECIISDSEDTKTRLA